MQGQAATQHLLVSDYSDKCLWWLRVEEQAGEVRLGQPVKHKLGYHPYRVTTATTGQAIVCDPNSSRLHVYSQPVHTGTCVELPQGVQPRVAVSNPAGGYAVISDHKLMWMTSDGKVTHCYTQEPDVSAFHMVTDCTNILVADYDNDCVHIVTGEGRHTGHLVTCQQGVKKPRCVSVDTNYHCVWIGHTGQDGKMEMMKVEHSQTSLNSPTLTLCAILPRTHT